jgi:rhamnosyltransferase subunit B
MNFLLIPMGSHGDVHPFVGVGRALAARGHAVTVLTSPYFEGLIRQAGLDFVPLGTVEEFEASLNHPDLWHPTRAFYYVVRSGIIPTLRPVYEFIRERYVPGNTVVAAGTLALGARIAQEKLGVPVASVHLQPVMFRSVHQPPILGKVVIPAWSPHWLTRSLFWLADTAFIDPALAKGVNGFRAELGLPPARRFFGDWLHSPQRTLGLFPDWYAPPQPDWPPQVRLTGFPLFDEAGLRQLLPDLEEFLAAGDQPIVFTAGSAQRQAPAFFREAVEASRLLGRRALLLTRFAEQLPANLPDGVRHFHYVPFSQVLPRCAALVHHGGIGTAAQGLAAGIPHLVMPFAHDQPDNAARLRRLGVGSSLTVQEFRAPAVARELRTLLDSPEVEARCAEYARRVREAEALEETCRALEEMVGTSKVPV